MESQLYLIGLYLVVEEKFEQVVGNVRLRRRGFPPALSDVEVITILMFGEYQGYGDDKKIWRYVQNHWLEWFPKLGSYKNFTKHCAKLAPITQRIYALVTQPKRDEIYIVDGLPMPVCKLARNKSCKLFPDFANIGYCASQKEYYYGFHGHLIITTTGEIRGFMLTPASGSERGALLEMVEELEGNMLADKGYIGEFFEAQMAEKNIKMHTPLRKNMKETRPPEFVKRVMNRRRYIETIIGKLLDQFSLLKSKARNSLTLSAKICRKLLSFSFALQIHGSTRFLES